MRALAAGIEARAMLRNTAAKARVPPGCFDSTSIPGVVFLAARGCEPRPVTLALGVAIDTTRELRIVSLGRRNDEVHVRSELETILVVVARREYRLGLTCILAHQASHIAKPMRRAEHRERPLAEEQINARRRRARIRHRTQFLECPEIVDLLQECEDVGAAGVRERGSSATRSESVASRGATP